MSSGPKTSTPQNLRTSEPQSLIVVGRIDIVKRPGVLHLHVDDPSAMGREHRLCADVRIRRSPVARTSSIEDHRVAVTIAVDGRAIGARVDATPRSPPPRYRDAPAERPRASRAPLRSADDHGVESGEERRQLSLLPSRMLDHAERRSCDGIADRTASMCAPATTVTSVTPPAISPRITRASTVSPVGPSGKTALARPIRAEAPAARTIARTMV